MELTVSCLKSQPTNRFQSYFVTIVKNNKYTKKTYDTKKYKNVLRAENLRLRITRW